MRYRLESRRLYIADLARRQHEMESGRVAMQPLAYRVLSKRLREALAGLPEPAARSGFSELPAHLLPLVAEMLETRHFDHHGRLHGAFAPHCRAIADTLISRLRQRS
jgi:hypothetical protein